MVDSHPYVHGKRFALVGDPDILLGMMSLIMEMGGEPVHIVCTNGDKHFEAEANELLASSPFGANGKVYAGKDMWHLRSLLFTDPVDLLIGNSYAKFLTRDTGTPLVRIGFPALRPAPSASPADHRVPGRDQPRDHDREHGAGRTGQEDRGFGEL